MVKVGIEVKVAVKADVDKVVAFLDEKCEWLKDKGSLQWQTGYTKRYNADYFRKCIQNGDILLLALQGGIIVGLLMLKKHSNYFPKDKGDAFYITHFASANLQAGRLLMTIALKISKTVGKKYLRGDCNKEIRGLVNYYKRFGAQVVGQGIAYNGRYKYTLLEYKV